VIVDLFTPFTKCGLPKTRKIVYNHVSTRIASAPITHLKGGEKEKMKSLFKRKTAGMLVFMMVVSTLLPIAASAAAWFKDVTYSSSTDTVSGYVYVDQATYAHITGNKIQIQVYGKNGEISLVDATYTTYAGAAEGTYYYSFSFAGSSYASYFPLKLRYQDPTATQGTYVETTAIDRSSSGNPGPGPIVVIPGDNTVDPEVTVDASGNVNAAQLAAALANDGKATVVITGEVALLPASALVGGEEVTITTDEGVSYILPIKALDLDALAKSLGVALADLKIEVGIETLAGTEADDVAKAAVAAKANVRSAAIDFTLSAVGGGKEEAITDLPVYVARVLPVTGEVANPGKLVVVRYNPTTGKFQPVPTSVTTTEDGKTNATANSRSNSIYAVIETEGKVFADLARHWAKADVEKLSNKLIVEGTSANSFEPKRSITRAEVAALIVRALGLETSGTTDKFSDVAADKWYSGAVAAAVEAGIINGLPNGTFNPNAAITRRDLAAMVVRAQVFAGKTVELTSDEVTKALSAYSDAATLGGQKEAVAIAVNSGLVKGQTGTKIAGLANTNRAEAATMIARLLTNVGFMS